MLPAVALLVPILGCALLSVEQGGFNLISLDEEWSMRDDLMKQVREEYTLVSDPQALAYLEGVGARLVAQTNLAGRPWTFGIIDDDAVNAFNLPGGLVYVNRGLIQNAATLDQFTSVLGHEIAHGAARHGTQLMTRQMGLGVLSSVLLGNDASQREQLLAGIVGSGVLSNYGRDAERESDTLGIRFAHAAGYDPEGAIAMFQMLLSLRQGRPSAVGQFFSSHPLTEERIDHARQITAELPRSASLIHDTPEYQAFRKRAGS
jgi:predicted Zn-dependent protease